MWVINNELELIFFKHLYSILTIAKRPINSSNDTLTGPAHLCYLQLLHVCPTLSQLWQQYHWNSHIKRWQKATGPWALAVTWVFQKDSYSKYLWGTLTKLWDIQSCISNQIPLLSQYSAPSIYRQHLFRADFGIKARVAI